MSEDGIVQLSSSLNAAVTAESAGIECLCSVTYQVTNHFDNNFYPGSNAMNVGLVKLHDKESNFPCRLKLCLSMGITLGVICFLFLAIFISYFYQGNKPDSTDTVVNHVLLDENDTPGWVWG